MRIDKFEAETDWAKLATAAQQAEAYGFDGFAIPEIVGDPLIHAAMAVRATERIQARTAIAVAFPRSPMVLASQAWSIQVNSGGRFALGIGHAGQRAQRAPVQHALEGAAKPDGRICQSASRDLALLGARRAPGLSGRALSVHADDAGVHAGEIGASDGAGVPGRRSAEDDRVGGKRGGRASTAWLLHEEVLEGSGVARNRPGSEVGRTVAQRARRVRGRLHHDWPRRRDRDEEPRVGAVPPRVLRVDALVSAGDVAPRLGGPSAETPSHVEDRAVEADGG